MGRPFDLGQIVIPCRNWLQFAHFRWFANLDVGIGKFFLNRHEYVLEPFPVGYLEHLIVILFFY